MASKKDDRLSLSPLGEYCEDLLAADSAINARTKAVQGSSLLCAKLQEREANIRLRCQYLADKRGISFDDMWRQLVTGLHQKISPEEWLELTELQETNKGS